MKMLLKDIASHYQSICRYLNFEDKGLVFVRGCGTVSMTKNSVYPQIAYEFGDLFDIIQSAIPAAVS